MAGSNRIAFHSLTSLSGLRSRDMLYFALRFCVYCAAGMSFFYFVPLNALLQPLLNIIASMVGRTLELTGLPVIVFGQKIRLPEAFGIDIALECSGIPHLIVFLSGVIAYPTSNGSRLVGVILATTAIFLGNLFRLFTLFLIGVLAREYFDFAHFCIWGGISIVSIVLLWMLWLRLSAIPHRQECKMRRIYGSCKKKLAERIEGHPTKLQIT